MKCVILAGGGGLRLWPLSRQQNPKQFMKVDSPHSMFAETVLRNLAFVDRFMILTNLEYQPIVEDQMADMGIVDYDLILEEIGRNTAPAITLACLRSDPADLLFVVPADARILADQRYKTAVARATEIASEGYLVTFGIQPTYAHTGYGYIHHDGETVRAFIEKPDSVHAKAYLDDGHYLWNSGMFLFRAGDFLQEARRHCPEVYRGCQQLNDRLPKVPLAVLDAPGMMAIEAISVDYAVMERSDRIRVVPSSFAWNDIGGLEALSAEVATKDAFANATLGKNIILRQTTGTSVINQAENHLVVVNQVSGLVIVNTDDAVYISLHGESSAIKTIITENRQAYSGFFDKNRVREGSWGSERTLSEGESFQIIRITIRSGCKHVHANRNADREMLVAVTGILELSINGSKKDFPHFEGIALTAGSSAHIVNTGSADAEVLVIVASD